MSSQYHGIHTSDRILFKRCRRKWNWASPLKSALSPTGEEPPALWFGSGFHFALEDFHGYREYDSPSDALDAYVKATARTSPSNADELITMGKGMLGHYQNWLKTRNEFETIWVDEKPLVEVSFKIPLPIERPDTGEQVYYTGTFDRCVRNEHGHSYLLDYKTAARIDTSKLDIDAQVSAYCALADMVLPELAPFMGMVYLQFLKAVPSPPLQLQSGGLSVNKNQNTTYLLYKRALIDGGFRKERKYVEFLTYLSNLEGWEGDKFIRRDVVTRNEAQKEAAYNQILQEVQEMLNPDLPLYPNPTKDCRWDCPFKAPCIAMDDGSDWEFLIQNNYLPRNIERASWRDSLGDSNGKETIEDVVERLLQSESDSAPTSSP